MIRSSSSRAAVLSVFSSEKHTSLEGYWESCSLTVPDLLHNELVEADLVYAFIPAVCLVDVQHLAMETLQLRVTQLWTQDLVIKLF